MGNRPFYIIAQLIECDGNEFSILYIGHNRKAAIARWVSAYNGVIDQEFVNNRGMDRDDVDIYVNDSVIRHPEELVPGRAFYANMSNNDDLYATVGLFCVKTGEFVEGWQEVLYRRTHPNSRY